MISGAGVFPPASDRQYQRVRIERVDDEGDGRYGVLREDGWSLLVGPSDIRPEAGDTMRCYGLGVGHVVRGIVIEGKGTVRYQTEAEARDQHRREQEERDAKRQRELEEQVADRDLRVRELPQPLRLRVERFQSARANWRRDFEPYEVFVCEEAAKIAQHFEGENAVFRLNQWADLEYADQQRELAVSDEHSGNTFGQAIVLARALLLGNDKLVVKAHGALCPLVGCEEYGCAASEQAS
jgi:hypothetical protein